MCHYKARTGDIAELYFETTVALTAFQGLALVVYLCLVFELLPK